MAWVVRFDEELAAWFDDQEAGLQDEILVYVRLLQEAGPNLGRPRADTVGGSIYGNMKELRIQYGGEPWRILFVFDPRRAAILLVGGNKVGDKRWYEKNIPIAEKRYKRHLEALALERERGKKKEK